MQRLVGFAAVFLIATLTAAGQSRKAFADASLYDKVVERVFETSLAAPPDGNLIVLRFSSGDTKEFQLAVAETPSQTTLSAERWRIPESAASIWVQLSQRADANPRLAVEDAAKAIHVEHQRGTIPASGDLARLVSSHRSLSLPLTGRTEFHLDGAQYLIRIRSVGEDIDVHLDGPADPSDSKDPIISWMGRVRRAAENVSLQSSS